MTADAPATPRLLYMTMIYLRPLFWTRVRAIHYDSHTQSKVALPL